jgi:penicillin V acylase-like amidase (Ntn superfamily)
MKKSFRTPNNAQRVRQKIFLSIAMFILCICLSPPEGITCTTFVLDNDGQPVYGKNMDWRPPVTAYIIVNKRGVQRTSLAPPEETTTTWTSQYGSVTFNFYGRGDRGDVHEYMN